MDSVVCGHGGADRAPNGCDPETQFVACETLAIIYEAGPQFFPKDPDRAQALRADLRVTAFRRCMEGDAAACTPMAKYVMTDTSLDRAAQIDLARESFTMMEDRCRGGYADMCDARV
jgi:hypothetical protein